VWTTPDRSQEAQRLRRLRAVLGLAQREHAVEFKVAHGAIAGWESGARTLPGQALKLVEIYEEELGLGAATEGLGRDQDERAGNEGWADALLGRLPTARWCTPRARDAAHQQPRHERDAWGAGVPRAKTGRTG